MSSQFERRDLDMSIRPQLIHPEIKEEDPYPFVLHQQTEPFIVHLDDHLWTIIRGPPLTDLTINTSYQDIKKHIVTQIIG